MQRCLVFDVETTGLPSKYNAKVEETNLWPYIVQISWLVYDSKEMDIIAIKDHIIKLPDGKTIPEDSTKIHGITNEMMNNQGCELFQILHNFFEDLSGCNTLVAHNMKFDKSVVTVECIRNKIEPLFEKKINFCTMLYGSPICKLTRINYRNQVVSKFPKLIELYKKLFNEVPNNLHNSLNDVLVCFRCYFKMRYNLDILMEDEGFSQYKCF